MFKTFTWSEASLSLDSGVLGGVTFSVDGPGRSESSNGAALADSSSSPSNSVCWTTPKPTDFEIRGRSSVDISVKSVAVVEHETWSAKIESSKNRIKF